jgi:hypothetical protein
LKKNSKNNEEEIQLRKLCVQLSAEGKNVTQIHRELNRTRDWVYKWLERSQSGQSGWYLDQSRAPLNKPGKIGKELEQAIVKSRIKLAKRDSPETKYAFCGAVAIHQELDNFGYRNKPALSTINRVLKRNGLIAKQKKDAKEKSSKKYFPHIKARHPGHLHQLDLVTPRYVKGFGVIISVNRIDVYTAQANLQQYQSKGADSVICFIIDDWKTFGIPRYLQLDNEASFRGSLYHPRTFGKLSRFCLNFGVELVFIPFNEPWRNAHIESFNSRFDKMLWQSIAFKDLDHLRAESKKFRDKHNNYQEYRKNNFGQQQPKSYQTRYLPKSFSFDISQDLPITRGRLHFVRMIKENGNINILNEDIYVDSTLSFEYVWAIISTKDRNVKIWYQPTKDAPKELLKTKTYELREPVKNKIPVKKFC